DVRRSERDPFGRGVLLEPFQGRVDARDVILERVLVETEVVEVEQACGVPAEAEDGPREEIEVLGVDAERVIGLGRHGTERDVPASPYEEGAVGSPLRLLWMRIPRTLPATESPQITGGDRLNSLEGGYCCLERVSVPGGCIEHRDLPERGERALPVRADHRGH